MSNLSAVKGINLVDMDGKLVEQLFISKELASKSVVVATVEDNELNVVGGGRNGDLLTIAGALIEQVANQSGQSITRVSSDLVSSLLAHKADREGMDSVLNEMLDEVRRMKNDL